MRASTASLIGAFVTALAVVASAAPAPAAPQPLYAAIVVLPDKIPAAYISIQNNQLRVAQTSADLATAKPTKATNTNIEETGRRSYQQFYDFPEVEVPISAPGITRAVAKINVYRFRSTARAGADSRDTVGLYGQISLSRRDASGHTWTYVYQVGQSGESLSKNSLERPMLLKVARAHPESLKLEITTKMEGRKARIGMQAKADGTDIYNVLKDGKNAPAKLEVTNKDGKHVVSETGDPVKFGFT